jgi:hypothetical protein
MRTAATLNDDSSGGVGIRSPQLGGMDQPTRNYVR